VRVPRVRFTVRSFMVFIAGTAVFFARYPVCVELEGFGLEGGMMHELWSDQTVTVTPVRVDRSHAVILKVRVRKYPFVVLEDWMDGTTCRLNWNIP
jgi:hypothetical protein